MVNVIERIAQSIGVHGLKMAYGEPTTIDGIELLPVALATYGFGGGGDDSENGGGLGWGTTIPIGVYSRSDSGVWFRPNPIALLLAAIPVIAITGWAAGRILKSLR